MRRSEHLAGTMPGAPKITRCQRTALASDNANRPAESVNQLTSSKPESP